MWLRALLRIAVGPGALPADITLNNLRSGDLFMVQRPLAELLTAYRDEFVLCGVVVVSSNFGPLIAASTDDLWLRHRSLFPNSTAQSSFVLVKLATLVEWARAGSGIAVVRRLSFRLHHGGSSDDSSACSPSVHRAITTAIESIRCDDDPAMAALLRANPDTTATLLANHLGATDADASESTVSETNIEQRRLDGLLSAVTSAHFVVDVFVRARLARRRKPASWYDSDDLLETGDLETSLERLFALGPSTLISF